MKIKMSYYLYGHGLWVLSLGFSPTLTVEVFDHGQVSMPPFPHLLKWRLACTSLSCVRINLVNA